MTEDLTNKYLDELSKLGLGKRIIVNDIIAGTLIAVHRDHIQIAQKDGDEDVIEMVKEKNITNVHIYTATHRIPHANRERG